jgi:flagellar motor switch protein FliM
MNNLLSQNEIDSLVEALKALKDYADDSTVTADMLNNQVVLTQAEIDKLISSLSTVKNMPAYKPEINVALSQNEIDALIDALNSYKEYGQLDELNMEILKNQSVMSQNEIDSLIEKLLTIKEDI